MTSESGAHPGLKPFELLKGREAALDELVRWLRENKQRLNETKLSKAAELFFNVAGAALPDPVSWVLIGVAVPSVIRQRGLADRDKQKGLVAGQDDEAYGINREDKLDILGRFVGSAVQAGFFRVLVNSLAFDRLTTGWKSVDLLFKPPMEITSAFPPPASEVAATLPTALAPDLAPPTVPSESIVSDVASSIQNVSTQTPPGIDQAQGVAEAAVQSGPVTEPITSAGIEVTKKVQQVVELMCKPGDPVDVSLVQRILWGLSEFQTNAVQTFESLPPEVQVGLVASLIAVATGATVVYGSLILREIVRSGSGTIRSRRVRHLASDIKAKFAASSDMLQIDSEEFRELIKDLGKFQKTLLYLKDAEEDLLEQVDGNVAELLAVLEDFAEAGHLDAPKFRLPFLGS